MFFGKVFSYEGDNNVFVWKHPTEDFNTGCQLIVHESQEAVFLSDGKVMDTFGPGRYTLETANLPIITNVMKLATGGRSAFHCELYFVNKTEQMGIPWGTDSKIQYLDPVYQFPVELGACGEMSLTAVNSAKLLVKIVGTENRLDQEKMTEYLRPFVMKYMKSALPKRIIAERINVFELDMHLPEFSEEVKDLLEDEFMDYGLKLSKFTIMTIMKPDEDPNYIRFKQLHYRRVNDVTEAQIRQQVGLINEQTKAQQTIIQAQSLAQKRQLEGYTYQEEKQFEIAKEIAGNEAIGQMNNIGVGLGMMAGIGGTIGGKVGTMASAALQDIPASPAPSGAKFCPNCGTPYQPGAQFCENCGTRLAKKTCPTCGNELSATAKFCPNCGTKVN